MSKITSVIATTITAVVAVGVLAAPARADLANLRLAKAKALMETSAQCAQLQYVAGSARYPYRFKAMYCTAPYVESCARWFHRSVAICLGKFRLVPTRMGQLYGFKSPLNCEGAMFYQTHRGQTRLLRKKSWRCTRDGYYNRAAA